MPVRPPAENPSVKLELKQIRHLRENLGHVEPARLERGRLAHAGADEGG
jgi:hypothetical protein